MVDVHLTQVAVLEEFEVIYISSLSSIELCHEGLDLSLGNFHVRFGQAFDEGIACDETGTLSVLLFKDLLKAIEISWGDLLSEILESGILDS